MLFVVATVPVLPFIVTEQLQSLEETLSILAQITARFELV
jgi:hypothetical protein